MGEEAKIEKALRQFIEGWGGLCLKWVSPQYTGVPDRIIFIANLIIIVELKQPKGKADARQEFVHDELEARGTKVHIIYTWEQLKKFKAYVIHAAQLPAPR